MKIFATAAFFLLAASQALAQESGAPARRDWNGFSADIQFGGAWGTSSWNDLYAGDVGSHHPSGVLGGLGAVFDRQIGAWVGESART